MTEALETTDAIVARPPKLPIGAIVWETILQLENDGRLITRRNLREVTGLSYEQIDESIKRLENNGKVIKAGGGLIEVVPLYPAERAQSLTALPDGLMKWEIGDFCIELTPPELRKHAMMLAGFARQYDDIEGSNRALVRNAELNDQLRDVRKELRDVSRELVLLKQDLGG
jgi:biotin operon repressor